VQVHPLSFRAFALTSLLTVVGCAGHAARTESARTALDANNPQRALTMLNEQLEVKSSKELPEEVDGDNALLLLDRSSVLQQVGEYQLSSRDLEVADKQVEMLDFSRSTADDIGRYLFSDDTGAYKSPPYEKLLINTMNMVNYLVRGDLNGARIEARRFAVMQKYLSENESASSALLGPGSYLAGFIFEKSGNPQEALRYYDEALAAGDFETLNASIAELATRASYRSPRITEILNQTGGTPASTPTGGTSTQQGAAAVPPAESPTPAEAEKPAELLVILCFGRVPAKVAKRVPIGLALTYASGALSPNDHARANSLAAQGLVTWVNYPELEPAKQYREMPLFELNEGQQELDGVPIDQLSVAAWNEGKGAVIASAITRMISRVVAGKAAEKAGGDGGVGLLLSLATQATLTAVDTPDTRSWSTLPGRIALGRVKLPAGKHTLKLSARGQTLKKTIELQPGGWAALPLIVLR
jgi:tetratricopeptide (TPR) repeat protein